MPNYKSFDDVLKELDMDEDELKRLVSEGQIRAFRDDDRMKFRSEDVASLARQRVPGSGGDDLDLGETQLGGEGLEVVEEETDETLLDLGNLSQDQDFEDTGATSVPTVELADAGGGDDQDATLTEELVFDETDELGGLDFGEGDADATQKIEGDLKLDDDELGLQTEPVEAKPKAKLPAKKKAAPAPAADDLDELDDLGTVDELDEPAAAPRQVGAPMGMPGPVQIQEQVKYVEIVPNEGVAWKAINGVTFLLVMVALITLPAIGMRQAKDPLVDFYGSTAYSLYNKSPNQALAQEPYHVKDQQTGKVIRPTAFSVGSGPKTVVHPGMPVIRSFRGYDVDSASGQTDSGDAPAAPAEGG
ncbi:MAG: hypothetical protein HS108_10395 [Planctomycetes bacterium]|nr:hypothetical protein [Planctomycetota bacterium]